MPTEDTTDTLIAESSPAHPLTHSPFFWLAGFLVLNIAVPFFNIPNRATAIIGAVALTFSYVCIAVFFAVTVARKKFSIPQLLIWGVLALLVWLALDNWITPAISKPLVAAFRKTGARPEGFQLLQMIALGTLTDMALLVIGVCAGNIASRMIRTPNMIAPICAVIGLIDIWGVLFGGIVFQMMQKTPHIAAKAMTKGPKLGAATGSAYSISLPDIGIGDYLFIGLLFAALVWLGLNWRDAVKWVVPLVSLALLALVLLPQIPPLPGLPFIALGVAIPNYKHFKYTREEKFALLYAGIFVVILTAALYWGFKSVLPEKKNSFPHPTERLTT